MTFSKYKSAFDSMLFCLTLCLTTNTSFAADNYFCWDYEVSETGSKGTRGLDYHTSSSIQTSGSFDTVIYNVDGFPNCLGGNSTVSYTHLTLPTIYSV